MVRDGASTEERVGEGASMALTVTASCLWFLRGSELSVWSLGLG